MCIQRNTLSQHIRTLTAIAAFSAVTLAGGAQANERPGEGVEVTPIFPSIAEERFRGEVAIAKLFDSNGDGKADLTGCNPGWGCELVIDHHLKAYGLEDTVTHNRGSYFALMADTIARYQEGKPIFYYTWVPQWIAGVLVEDKDVVWLEVPFTSLPDGNNEVNTTFNGKNLGFAVDQVMAVMNREFAENNPAATTFLSLLQIPASDESAQNLKMQNGEKSIEDIKRHAQEWIAAHREPFDNWLAQARAAAD